MPGVVDTDALQAALAALTARGRSTPDSDRAATVLAFRVLGAAEGQAKQAQTGATPEDSDEHDVLIAEAFGAAGCESELDALDLVRWRAQLLSHALDYVDLGGPYGARDRMMGTIGVTAATLARMVDAAYVMRHPESDAAEQKAAAETWWAATDRLRQAIGIGTGEVQLAPDHGHEHGPQGCPSCSC